ncbi:hypothetical protein HQ447_20790 [bacterium]|nr:hypothetical protein [bacterium]
MNIPTTAIRKSAAGHPLDAAEIADLQAPLGDIVREEDDKRRKSIPRKTAVATPPGGGRPLGISSAPPPQDAGCAS